MDPDPAQTPLLGSRLIDRIPVHYGWVVLGAATVGMVISIPGQTVGVSVFLDSIIADLGLGRSAVSGAYTVGTLLGALSLPLVGRYIDRYGPQRSVTAIAVLFAIACAVMSLAQGLVTLLIGFILIRGLGFGALGLVSIHSINIWFVRRRGLAVGLAGLGFAAATSVFPLGIELLISKIGWRWSYAALGLVVAGVMVPVGAGFFRHRPELYGVLPDTHTPTVKDAARIPERHYKLGEARRTITFSLYIGGGFLAGAVGTALLFHHFSIIAENGLGRSEAATMFVAYGIFFASANLLIAFLVDWVPPRFLLSFALVLMAAAMLGATRVLTLGAVLGYGVVLGSMVGASIALQSTVYAHYFGRIHLGALKGFARAVTAVGTAVGPLVLALGFDAAGSYRPILTYTAAIPILMAVVAPFLPLNRNGRIL